MSAMLEAAARVASKCKCSVTSETSTTEFRVPVCFVRSGIREMLGRHNDRACVLHENGVLGKFKVAENGLCGSDTSL
jgi:hypothetical protein